MPYIYRDPSGPDPWAPMQSPGVIENEKRPETDLQYLVRRISPTETIEALNRFPRYFEIETVNACQARCPMCTIADWNRKDGVMKDDLFEKIASELEQHADEVIRVHLYRDGEPLLDKKLPQRIKRLKYAGVKKVGISTNVELLDGPRSAAILEAGIDEVILSVDSVHKEAYEKIRVGLDFEKVLIHAKMFFYYRNTINKNCQIRVRMVRQELNAPEWDSGEYQRVWAKYASRRDTIEDHNLHNWGGQLKGYASQGATDKPCIALWSLMCIFADGSVPMCNVDYNRKHPLGNVKNNTIAELWRSQIQEHRRQTHLNQQRHMIDLCKNCTVWSEHGDKHQSGPQGATA